MHASKDLMWRGIWKILQNFLGTKQSLRTEFLVDMLQSLEKEHASPFACLISRIFSASQHYFSLMINQRTVFSAMAFQTNENSYLFVVYETWIYYSFLFMSGYIIWMIICNCVRPNTIKILSLFHWKVFKCILRMDP